MSESDQKADQDEVVNQLIKEAYAATLDPERLLKFEQYWEAYIDAQLQRSPEGFDWENTPINAHITLAMDIIERVRTTTERLDEAQHLVESHYGFGFIIDEVGRIIVSNTDASSFTRNREFLDQLSIDNISIKNIMNWLKSSEKEYNFFHVHIGGGSRAIPLFISPIKIEREPGKNALDHFLITSVETKLSLTACRIIGKSFGMSGAESTVAGMLADGCSPKEIAELRDVKITAVRSQIAKIKSKMNATDIPDIVRRFISMGLRERSTRTQINRMEAIRGINRSTIRESNMTLLDGRRLQYFEQGHPKGKCILQIHSLIGGVEFPDKISQALVHSGYRMISPSRAGFGKSEPNRKQNILEVVNACVSDLKELLDHIGAKDVIVLTDWAGAIAQKLALKDKERINGLVLSGAVPVWESHYLDLLSDHDRVAVKTSIHAPKALPYLMGVRKAMRVTEHPGVFMGGLDKHNVPEATALRKLGASDLKLKRFHHILNQGIWAFIEDLPYIHSDWCDDASKLGIPVSIVKGSQNQDHLDEAIARYINAVPQAKIKSIEGAGAYQNLTHFGDIFDEIKLMVEQMA